MAELFSGGHLRFLNGEWRDDNGDPVEIEKVSHGRWIIHSCGHGVYANNWAECSECGTCGSPQWKRCPVCEAKMDKGE